MQPNWLPPFKSLRVTDATQVAINTGFSYAHLGATGVARHWKVRGRIGSTGTRVSNVALWEELLGELHKPGRTIQGVQIPSHVGVEGNAQADLLANVGKQANPLHPSQQRGTQCCDQSGEPPPKRRKVEHEPSSHRRESSQCWVQQLFCSPWGWRL